MPTISELLCKISNTVRGASEACDQDVQWYGAWSKRAKQQRNVSKSCIVLVVDIFDPSKRRLKVLKDNIDNVLFLNRCEEYVIF
jgi:hypothetical protein